MLPSEGEMSQRKKNHTPYAIEAFSSVAQCLSDCNVPDRTLGLGGTGPSMKDLFSILVKHF